ncbi:cell wall-binding protein [Virgibacillus phasianinus]|uniref:Cell wall-binding protein n=1 Tax=Virgibacillus phasianinus TaxID=2017483 RepID=A0A220U2C3_9BACI|nr:3D domain-containing protein [Virgibacillus phasianinus]ASK61991.1 cell wall-binding protein [Virgibacillus phasianinus]
MKKLVAIIATGIIIAGAGMTSVSAEEYQVEKGDSLWDIANEYNTTVDDLVEINALKSTVIHPKQKLFINETYKVEKGDTLIGIGDEFDVAVDDIKSWNNLDSDIIVIGQELKINGVNIDQQQDNQPAKAEKASASEETQKAEPKTETTKKAEPKTESDDSNSAEKAENDSPDGKTISVSATAYTADCPGCSGVTSTGIDLNANPDAKVIAVDPNVIPLGSEVYVEGYGRAVAGDVGSGINGNEIDVHVGSKSEANTWGVKTVNVTILD